MKMFRLLAIFLLLTGFPLAQIQLVRAQSAPHPDFTGTWKIDRDLSSPRAIADFDDLILAVTQRPAELQVNRVIGEKKHREHISDVTYFTDGRGEKTSLLFGKEKWDSRTRWVNDTIVCKFTVTDYLSTNSDFYYIDYKETWALLQHGNTLVITTEKAVRNVPDFYRSTYTDETYRMVFHRVIL